jgi:hypothetical protein
VFVVELIYKAALEDIDVHMAPHVRFRIHSAHAASPDFRIIEFRASSRLTTSSGG